MELAAPEKPLEPYTGKMPNLPRRGYYRVGDGYKVLTGTRPSIRAIQEFCNWYISGGLTVDGKYGPRTAAAVAKAQRHLGVTVDGLYGRDTLTAVANLVE